MAQRGLLRRLLAVGTAVGRRCLAGARRFGGGGGSALTEATGGPDGPSKEGSGLWWAGQMDGETSQN